MAELGEANEGLQKRLLAAEEELMLKERERELKEVAALRESEVRAIYIHYIYIYIYIHIYI